MVTTVKPLNKGHIWDGLFVPCREVVIFLEVFYWKVLKDKKCTNDMLEMSTLD